MDSRESQARLRLSRSKGIGPRSFWALLRRFETGLNVPTRHLAPLSQIAQEEACAHALGAHLLHGDRPPLAEALRSLPDPPACLWALGDLSLLRRPMIALVGARNASSLGQRMAERLAEDLTEAGYLVISGLARGIDAAAHRGALRKGPTLAVLGTGLAQSYPPENTTLQTEIGQKGLLLSEYPPQTGPKSYHFPARNRIVAALAQAVVVVEASERSGSLLTARDALDIGRDVFAVPGHPFDARSAGCNRLLRDGAVLIRHASDIIAALPPLCTPAPPPAAPPTPTSIDQVQNPLLALLGAQPSPSETLRLHLGLAPDHFAQLLAEAELSGEIERVSGGQIVRNTSFSRQSPLRPQQD